MNLISWHKSKYILSLFVSAAWMMFFDDRDIVTTHFRHPQELLELQQSKTYYQQQINNTRTELQQLKLNTATIEKYAREKYFMKRDNEDLFVVSDK